MRLRNIGGLIVVDFIDMKAERDRKAVYKAMREGLRRDKAKTQILPISPFGLMEMTRQRLHESLSTSIFDPCPYCHGHGRIKSATSMSVQTRDGRGRGSTATAPTSSPPSPTSCAPR